MFIAAHPQSQFKDELNPHEFNKFLNGEENETDIENQPIHWLAAVVCVNMGKFLVSIFRDRQTILLQIIGDPTYGNFF